MRFIKKLVILTGSGARGTLMLEKNGYGVWCKLNIFDLPAGEYRFVIISGDDLFVMKYDRNTTNFELGEIDFEEIHAAIVGSQVVMYGSNCAKKLSGDAIMQRLKSHTQKAKKEEANYITFSGRDKKIEDYFKEIAPPQYNDFAIAEKNYYPAYVSMLSDVAATIDIEVPQEEVIIKSELKEEHAQETEADSRQTQPPKQTKEQPPKQDQSAKQVNRSKQAQAKKRQPKAEQVEKPPHTQITEREEMENKMMPHELEQKYLSLIWAQKAGGTNEQIKAVQQNKETDKAQEPIKVATEPEQKITTAEKPEVIAMARRITLRDYRVEGAKPTGRRATYFERSSAQLEKLMASNERFVAAEKLIPGSKFVKINYDQKRYYIVGVIGKDYICYGVPSVYSEVPPEPLCGYARWLPFDAGNPHAEGFWMMYQDGVSGETLKS